MSASNGGPWGTGGGDKPSSGKNPWERKPDKTTDSSSGGGGNAPLPPELDALLRDGQARFKQIVPEGFNGKSTLIAIAALTLIWGLSGFYQVAAGELGVVLRFGVPVRVEAPGLRYHLPVPLEEVELPEVTALRKIEIGFRSDEGRGQMEQDAVDESRILTGDENIIDVNFTVVWQVAPDRVKDFLFNIREPEQTVKAAAESVMREVIGKTDIKTAITGGRSEIEARTQDELQKLVNQYQAGIVIAQVSLRGAKPPAEVADAFQDVTRARSDKETAINQAETYRSKIIPEAEGKAMQMLQEAEAYKQQVINVATGDAARFASVYQSYSLAKDVTAKKMYLEMMEGVLRDANKIIVDPALKASGVTPYLPLNELTRASSSPKSAN